MGDDDGRERELEVDAHEEDEQREPDEEARERDRQEEEQGERPAQPRARAREPEGRERPEQQRDSDVQAATKRLFQSAELKPGSESTKSYQRSENPVNGSDSEPVSWNENSTTNASGTYRNSSAAIVNASDVRERTVTRSAPGRGVASRSPTRIAK